MRTATVLHPETTGGIEGVIVAKAQTMEKRKIVSMTDELANAIEDFRFSERISSEAEAIRMLLVAGLKAKGRGLDQKAQ